MKNENVYPPPPPASYAYGNRWGETERYNYHNQYFIIQTGTKLERKVVDFKFVNISTSDLKLSPRNLSLFLKKEMLNPWSLSPEFAQVIQEENVIFEYAGQEKYNSTNLLGVLVLSILFGAVLNGLGEKGRPLAELFDSLFNLLMQVVMMIIW